MKIDEVRVTKLVMPLKKPIADSTHVLKKIEWIVVEILTDEGITGNSFMLTFDYGTELLKGIVETELKKEIIGKDPQYINKIWDAVWNRTEYIGQSGVAAWGIAAIDIALWDLLGKSLGSPVYKLLGAYTDEVPIYGSGGWLSYSTDELLDEANRYLKRGFTAVKMKVGSPDQKRDVERVKEVRKCVGEDILLMVDANQAWTPDEAIHFGKRVQDQNIFWFEEPTSKDNIAGYARIAASLEIPLATGEREYSLGAFRELMEQKGATIIQPDALRIGGITPWMKLAHLAETFHLRVASHFYKEIDIHVLASVRNGLFLEFFPWLDDLLINPLEIVNGVAKVPQRPGLGVEFKPEAIREYAAD
jgi:L-alanine-DL-glutamate epimerase-like enolase superfamily enzyme